MPGGPTTGVSAQGGGRGRNADRIVVVDETGVAEQGRHSELLAGDGPYSRLHAAQFEDVVG